MRQFIVPVLFCVAAAQTTAQTPVSNASASTGSAAPSVIRDAAQSGVLNGLRWPRFPYYRDELKSLYTAAGWRPLWTLNGRPTPAARSAIDALRSAQDRGLHPEDYDATKLDQQFRKLSSGAASPRDVEWFDAALSIGVLRHVSDLHIGRVNPKNMSVRINVEPKKLDLARELSDAIARNRVTELVRDAEPRFVQYRNLKAAYAKYRALAADTTLPTVTVAGTVRPGETLAEVAQLRRRLAAFGDLPAAAAHTAPAATYDGTTVAAVSRFQERHGLGADGVLGPATVAAINVSPARRARQIELALERIRWLPDLRGTPFIVANVPSFQLYAFDSAGGTGAPAVQMNVVVGKANVGRETPLFERDMQYIIFRPYWVIPPGILRNETLPAIRRDGSYLSRNNMELYLGDGDNGRALPATSENISRIGRGVGVRQRPGPKNALGLAKFIFPNDHNVYMHGTPAQELFSRSRRDFSHGCIRVESPAGLATWVLRDPNEWSRKKVEQAMNADRSQKVNLAKPLPVIIYYTTAVVRPDGTVAFFDDVYKHDARLERTLEKGYPFAP